jgi:hypothetical protein
MEVDGQDGYMDSWPCNPVANVVPYFFDCLYFLHSHNATEDPRSARRELTSPAASDYSVLRDDDHIDVLVPALTSSSRASPANP